MTLGTFSVRRCPEMRAHYAHEWYNPALRVQCPGGPDETAPDAVRAQAKAEALREAADWARGNAMSELSTHYLYHRADQIGGAS